MAGKCKMEIIGLKGRNLKALVNNIKQITRNYLSLSETRSVQESLGLFDYQEV